MESIIGGVETIITEAGCITTPSPSDTDTGGGPGDRPGEMADGKYPVVLNLDIIVDDSGEGYEGGDTIVIDPPFGAEADVTFDIRRISRIKL